MKNYERSLVRTREEIKQQPTRGAFTLYLLIPDIYLSIQRRCEAFTRKVRSYASTSYARLVVELVLIVSLMISRTRTSFLSFPAGHTRGGAPNLTSPPSLGKQTHESKGVSWLYSFGTEEQRRVSGSGAV